MSKLKRPSDLTMTEVIILLQYHRHKVKTGLLLILMLLLVSPSQAQGPDKIMSCHVRNVPFTEFCEVVLRETGVRIFYREDWINKLNVTLDSDSITARSALRTVLEGTDLEYLYGTTTWSLFLA